MGRGQVIFFVVWMVLGFTAVGLGLWNGRNIWKWCRDRIRRYW